MGSHTADLIILLDHSLNPYGLQLELCDNGVECLGSILLEAPTEGLTPDILNAILVQQGITETIHTDQLHQFCQDLSQGNRPKEVLLAEGRRPAQGIDGSLELFDLQVGKALYQEDAHGIVDLKTVRVFDNVLPGQQVARIHPPAEGEPGVTATGQPIPGQPGKALSLKIGKGLDLDPVSGLLVATLSGRLVHEGKKIEVSESYDVSGDVDYAIGNITFNGKVNISGDVLDGFSIQATGDITIGGSVGNCIIKSDGDIVLGSMSSVGHGLIRAGGSITARYINETIVEAQKDISIQNEIRNCLIKTRGALHVNGVIVGGECIALQGIETNAVGGPSNIATILRVGEDFALADRLAFLQMRLHEVTRESNSILHLVGKMRERIDTEVEDEPVNIQRLLERYEGLKNTQEVIEGELEQYLGKVPENRNPKINVKNLIFEGTRVTMENVGLRFNEDVPGPVSVYYSQRQQQILTSKLTPLTINALQMDEQDEDV